MVFNVSGLPLQKKQAHSWISYETMRIWLPTRIHFIPSFVIRAVVQGTSPFRPHCSLRYTRRRNFGSFTIWAKSSQRTLAKKTARPHDLLSTMSCGCLTPFGGFIRLVLFYIYHGRCLSFDGLGLS